MELLGKFEIDAQPDYKGCSAMEYSMHMEYFIRVSLFPIGLGSLYEHPRYVNFVRRARLEQIGSFEAGTYVPVVGTNFYSSEYTAKVEFQSAGEDFNPIVEPYSALSETGNGSVISSGSDIILKGGYITSGITLNPEYLTVEGDVDMFNLEKSEVLYYPEKSPFLEGFELWNMDFKVLHTRKISDINGGLELNLKYKTAQYFWCQQTRFFSY